MITIDRRSKRLPFLLLLLSFSLGVLAISETCQAQDKTPVIDKLDQLEFENTNLRLQALEIQAKQLIDKRDAILKKYNLVLNGDGQVSQAPKAVAKTETLPTKGGKK